jgi:TP901 family phage tail tape measure protein
VASVGDISVRLGLDVKDFQKGLQESEKKMKNFGTKLSDVGKSLSLSLAVPLSALGIGAIKVGADFEQGMKKVQAVTGASEKEFALLEAKARELGATTKFSAKEVADGMGFLGMAGFKTNEILDATEGMLNLASISMMDLGSTADIVSNMLSGMGMEANEVNKMVDTLAYTMTNSNVDIAMLGETFTYVAPTASNLGVKLSELSASIGILGDAGIQGSMAGTSLATGLSRLASPSASASKLMKKLGISVWDAEGKLKSLPEVVSQFEKGLDGLTDQQRQEALATIFGLESVKGWSTLISRGSGYLEEFAGKIDNADGAGANLAETMNDTLNGRLLGLKSAIEDVGISVYQMLEEPLKKVTEAVTDAVRWFGELDSSTQGIILAIAGLAVVVPPILLVVGLMIKGFGLLSGIMAGLFGPVTLIVAGIVALGSALIIAWQKSETFRNIVTSAFQTVKEVATEVFEKVASFVKEKISEIKNFWDTHGEQIKQAFTNVLNAIGSAFKVVFPIIKEIVFSTIENIKGIINGVITFFEGVIEFFTGIFTGDWKLAWEGIKKIFSGALQAIWNFIQITLIGKVLKFFKGFGGKIWDAIKGIGKKLLKPFKDGWNSIKTTINNMKSGVTSKVKSISDSVKSKISKVKEYLVKPFKDGYNKVKEWVNKIKDKVKNIFKVNIKTPKFSISGSLNPAKWVSQGLPKLKVSWNAKGNIFDGATLLGGGQGVGEAGAEAVIPIEHKRYMKPFATNIANLLKEDISTNDKGNVTNNFNIEKLVVREEADVKRIAKELERIQKQQERAKGIFAY